MAQLAKPVLEKPGVNSLLSATFNININSNALVRVFFDWHQTREERVDFLITCKRQETQQHEVCVAFFHLHEKGRFKTTSVVSVHSYCGKCMRAGVHGQVATRPHWQHLHFAQIICHCQHVTMCSMTLTNPTMCQCHSLIMLTGN